MAGSAFRYWHTLIYQGPGSTEVFDAAHALADSRWFSRDVVPSLSELTMRLGTGGVHCVVLAVLRIDAETLRLVDHALAREVIVVVICGEADGNREAQMRSRKRVIVLERPAPQEALRVIERMASGDRHGYRHDRRFPSAQSVSVESRRQRRTFLGSLRNLSASGASLDLQGGTLHVREAVRIAVRLDELSKSHVLFGSVVWVASVEGSAGCSFGVRFVDQDTFQLLADDL